MTDEVIFTAAGAADVIAKLRSRPDISDEEAYYLDAALRNLKSFAVVYRYKKVFKED